MAWKVELSRAAERAQRNATAAGWIADGTSDEEVGELERAGFVYDGAVTSNGYERDKQSR